MFLYALAELGTRPLPARAALVEEAIEHARSDDERAARLLGLLAIVRWLLGDAESALQHAHEGLACAESVGDPELLAVAIARVGHIEGWVLDVTPGLLERGVAIERTLRRPLMFHTSPAFMQACLLYDQDELARSRQMLLEIEGAAIARGDEHTRLWVVLQWPVARVVHRPVGTRTPAHGGSPRARRADSGADLPRPSVEGQGAHAGGTRTRRGGAFIRRGGSARHGWHAR